MRAGLVRAVVCLGLALAVAGCLERDLAELNPCLTTTIGRTVQIDNIDKVDLLFVVDDSNSMKEEQASLRREFPKLIRTLTSGVREDGTMFRPVRDLHLGVVSTDLGAGGQPQLSNTQCVGSGGDGILQHVSNPGGDPSLIMDCPSGVDVQPSFLSFVPGEDDPDRVASDFQCIATLGTGGCGFEQQLESMLKAIAPEVLPGTDPNDPQLRFLDGNGMLTPGQGDRANAGFLRNGSGPEQSLLAIIMVTDEEDCSSRDTSHFNLADGELRNELRCYLNKDHLHDVQTRYLAALRALRPDDKHLIFAAIAGVPTTLVDDAARAAVDWKDAASIDAYYQRMLDDPSMQERVAPSGDKLEASCIREVDGLNQVAYPPRRLVELARAFGKNGVVQSICQESFAHAMDVLIDAIVANLGNVCLPRTLVPNSEGMVEGCEVVWELPASPRVGSIASCDERPYLAGRTNLDGRAECVVEQVPVRAGAPLAGRSGWFYDDFSKELLESCVDQPQRIAFTDPPPSGVTVKLDCAENIPLPPRDPELAALPSQPTLGTDCRGADDTPDDSRCAVTKPNGEREQRMRCHPEANVCVMPCGGDIDCPAAWRCDDRPDTVATAGSPICTNPTCVEEE